MDSTIELRGLVKTYKGAQQGRVHAVRGVDLSIAQGEIVALLGPNGAGKSTTIDVMQHGDDYRRRDRRSSVDVGLAPSARPQRP